MSTKESSADSVNPAFQSSLIDPATGQVFGSAPRKLVPTVEDFDPVQDTDIQQLRQMLEGAFEQGCQPTDCIPASLQSLAMMLRALELHAGEE